MKTIFTYDTETTGLPNWKVPSDSPEQPHLVQLAGVLSNAETGEEIQSMNVIIKPDGWEIPEEVTAVHGITTEYALEHGIPALPAAPVPARFSAGRQSRP
uniref:exonuclease domain-containing protein n=1 Tax=Serratia quinivorans TaxID=137545 RepID=UPI0035C670C3